MLELPDERFWSSGTADSEPPRCSPGRRDFTSLSHVFHGSSRLFALFGQLHLASGGRVFLQDFLAALSRVCQGHETSSVLAVVIAQIERIGWEKTTGAGWEWNFQSSGFDLSLGVAVIVPGIESVHILLKYGSVEPYVKQYLGRQFPEHVRTMVSAHTPRGASDSLKGHVQTPRVIQTAELAWWFRREPCIVLTGAGISLASGIRPFIGPGSLEISFRLDESFPGSAFDWMLRRPSELASLVGSFQASILMARPNPAHRALAALEKMGVVKQIITSNFDELHQLAGSVSVQEISGRKRWTSGFAVKSLLAVGVSHDEFGLVSTARASGMGVVVLNPEVPAFVQESDQYLPGRAEVILPEVVEILGRENE